MTNYRFLIILMIGLFFPFPSICAPISLRNEEFPLTKMQTPSKHLDAISKDMEQPIRETSFQSMENGMTAGHRPGKVQRAWRHRRRLRDMHGILNIIGWGFLLPMGAIVARNFRESPIKCEEWYPLHTLCQTSGYILGSVGWGIGMWLGNTSKKYNLKTHRILGIIIFTFATIQMSALCLQPRKEGEHRKSWEIIHDVLGYALLAIIIANIFEGINHHSHSQRWKWVYVGLLATLGLVALALEIFRWIKSKHQHHNSIYTSTQI